MGLKVQATCFSAASINFNENKRRHVKRNDIADNYSLTVSY